MASLLIFAGLHVGAPYGYRDWLAVLAITLLGNMVGGLGLVTMLRLVQVGGDRLAQAREDGQERR